jgi:hypothetical protein
VKFLLRAADGASRLSFACVAQPEGEVSSP